LTSRNRADISRRHVQSTTRRGTSAPWEPSRLGVVNLQTGKIANGPQ
jgi:hypothetical protein